MAADPTRTPAGPAAGGGAGGLGRRLSTETRRAITTTEFYSYVAVVAGVLIAAALIKGDDGDQDKFTATQAWLYVTILTVGYMLARGWAKSGSRERYWDEGPGDH